MHTYWWPRKNDPGLYLQSGECFGVRVSGSAGILFRCERSDNRFKSRVTPQWVPQRIETQIAVSNMAPWQLHYLSQSFNCAILVARPRINDREILNHPRAIDRVFADGDQ